MFGIETGRVTCTGCSQLFTYRQVVFHMGPGAGFRCEACRTTPETEGSGNSGPAESADPTN